MFVALWPMFLGLIALACPKVFLPQSKVARWGLNAAILITALFTLWIALFMFFWFCALHGPFQMALRLVMAVLFFLLGLKLIQPIVTRRHAACQNIPNALTTTTIITLAAYFSIIITITFAFVLSYIVGHPIVIPS